MLIALLAWVALIGFIAWVACSPRSASIFFSSNAINAMNAIHAINASYPIVTDTKSLRALTF
jgi:hypothetical protein